MATCKECVHNNICNIKQRYNHPKYALQHIEKYCEHFKDRSRFVELPCKHGDTLFRLENGKIEKGVATTFFYGNEFQIVNCRFPKISTGIPFHRFGKSVFLTREEAEQALKERDGNGGA